MGLWAFFAPVAWGHDRPAVNVQGCCSFLSPSLGVASVATGRHARGDIRQPAPVDVVTNTVIAEPNETTADPENLPAPTGRRRKPPASPEPGAALSPAVAADEPGRPAGGEARAALPIPTGRRRKPPAEELPATVVPAPTGRRRKLPADAPAEPPVGVAASVAAEPPVQVKTRRHAGPAAAEAPQARPTIVTAAPPQSEPRAEWHAGPRHSAPRPSAPRPSVTRPSVTRPAATAPVLGDAPLAEPEVQVAAREVTAHEVAAHGVAARELAAEPIELGPSTHRKPGRRGPVVAGVASLATVAPASGQRRRPRTSLVGLPNATSLIAGAAVAAVAAAAVVNGGGSDLDNENVAQSSSVDMALASPDRAQQEIQAQATAERERAVKASRQRARAALDARKKAAAELERKQEVARKAAEAARARAERIIALAKSFRLPVSGYRLTAHFGAYGLWSHGHTGLDFAAPYGTAIRAVASGTVVSASWDGAYGWKTVIRLADGTEHWYAHQSAFVVRRGYVNAGDLIGRVGSTGRSTGSHLHFEVRINDKPVNPLTWLRARGLHP